LTLIRALGVNRSQRNSGTGLAVGQCCLPASTREGEEELLLDAMEQNALGDALLVIVPRHPQRFDSVAQLLASRGLKFVRRSTNAPLDADCGIVLGDSMGEMAAYYRPATLLSSEEACSPTGGQNLIEACAAGVPVLIGPYTLQFRAGGRKARSRPARRCASTLPRNDTVARSILQDAGLRERMGKAGVAFCAAHRGATERTLAICERLLG